MKYLWLRVNVHFVRHDGLFVQTGIGPRLVMHGCIRWTIVVSHLHYPQFWHKFVRTCSCVCLNFVLCPAMTLHRTYKDECSFIERLNENAFLIKKGFVPNMKVSKVSWSQARFGPLARCLPWKSLQKKNKEVQDIYAFYAYFKCFILVPILFSGKYFSEILLYEGRISMWQQFFVLSCPCPLLSHKPPLLFQHLSYILSSYRDGNITPYILLFFQTSPVSIFRHPAWAWILCA